MEYTRLGQTGMEVSRICLGCMTYGDPNRGAHPWTLPEEQARPLLRRAIELGINFFDTANTYSDGTSEEFLGRAIRDFANRDEVVIAIKVYFPLRKGLNGRGLSRKAIMAGIDASLKRLGTDYVDLYQIHRWDHDTPIEVTLEALHDVVKAGKAHYIGASSMFAWRFVRHSPCGPARLDALRHHARPLQSAVPRREREMLPLCAEEKIAVLPWSPLARGRLARAWMRAPAGWKPMSTGRSFTSLPTTRTVAL